MANQFEQAVSAYATDRTTENLARLDRALVQSIFLIPVSYDAVGLEGSVFDIPAICFRREDGVGVLPAFTTVENLLSWDSDGSKYVELVGSALLKMARGMADVQEVGVNPSGSPRGTIPRCEFDRLLDLPS